MSRRWWAALAALVLALTGCGSTSGEGGSGASTPRQQVTVFAAASLKAAFTEVAALDPGLDVRFSFDGSSALVDQLAGGAPADVFASADTKNMDRARSQGLVVGTPATFASNHLVLVVAPGNPLGITGLDATLDGHKLVVCAPQVPCGNASRQLAERLGYTMHPVSEETKVTDVLGKVLAGAADAGLVYVTDATSAGDKVATVTIPKATEVPNTYPIAAVAGAKNSEGASAFIALVTSERGQDVLRRHGFAPAP